MLIFQNMLDDFQEIVDDFMHKNTFTIFKSVL